jgi:hypothetical protein
MSLTSNDVPTVIDGLVVMALTYFQTSLTCNKSAWVLPEFSAGDLGLVFSKVVFGQFVNMQRFVKVDVSAVENVRQEVHRDAAHTRICCKRLDCIFKEPDQSFPVVA